MVPSHFGRHLPKLESGGLSCETYNQKDRDTAQVLWNPETRQGTPPIRGRNVIGIEFANNSVHCRWARRDDIFPLIDSEVPRARRMSSTINELRTCTFPQVPHYNPLLL